MKQVLQNDRSRELQVAEVPAPGVRAGQVLVRNVASLISAGTERAAVDFGQKSLLQKARSRPDLVRQVVERVRKEGLGPTIEAVRSRLDQPVPLGYSCAGVVEEVGAGVTEFSPGQRVACAGAGYANHAELVVVPRNLVVAIPDPVSFEDAAYVTLGAIALHGVRTADVHVGDVVAVIGLGLLGQLTVQLLRAAGCQVVGIDLDPEKVQLARDLGAERAVVRSGGVDAAVAELTGSRGADAAIITAASSSNDPVELAGQICRDRGRVTVVGAVGMTIPREIYYRKELELRISRSYGPGRYDPAYEEKGHDYPVGYVRWTERRNLEEFLRLVSRGLVTPGRMTTHRFAVEQAPEAYELITGVRREPFLGILLTYPSAASAAPQRTVRLTPRPVRQGRVRLGVIGAGSFGRTVLLPRLAKHPLAELIGIATASGVSAKASGDRFGFRFCTTEPAAILDDPEIDAVVIATRHGSHARLAAAALRAGKAVFLEKPLATDEAGLLEVLDAQRETGGLLAVGFNRRFSPLAQALRDGFRDVGALAVTYRVNAGPLPANHWLYDSEEGGGRIIGEACHFVDLVQYLTGEEPISVHAIAADHGGESPRDTVLATVGLRGGSVASIAYVSSGDRGFPKERVEVFGGGGVGVLDDFRELTLSRGGKQRVIAAKRQEKGFDQELDAFLATVRSGGAPPIPLESLVVTTRATFAVEESLRTGLPVRLAPLASG
ncbi:MAG: bi-domain-containing oxidoreductase [Gemmatimonadetes bacterium]|nr:bi-domain-containing oxidoreductase [Gemmatimonadota bacterium]